MIYLPRVDFASDVDPCLGRDFSTLRAFLRRRSAFELLVWYIGARYLILGYSDTFFAFKASGRGRDVATIHKKYPRKLGSSG